MSPNPISLVSLEEEIRTQRHRGKALEDTERRQPSIKRGKEEETNPADAWIQEF